MYAMYTMKHEALSYGNAALFAASHIAPIDNFLSLSRSTYHTLMALKGERSVGEKRRIALVRDVERAADLPQFREKDNERERKVLLQKLQSFRPRRIGAIAAYSVFTRKPYEAIVDQGGIDSFYLFWALGGSQDDFIDCLPKKSVPVEKEKHLIKEAIFGEKRKIYRGALYLLNNKTEALDMARPEKNYVKQRVAHWYKFLIDQESHIIHTPFDQYTFDYSRKYREDQNFEAGRVATVCLNGRGCLDPKLQRFETILPRFSYLTQMIDDIADTAEDVLAQRPSFSVGALIDHPQELERFRSEVIDKGVEKVYPSLLKKVAPQAYAQIYHTFQEYCSILEKEIGIDARGLTTIATAIYHVFPKIRGVLYRLHPELSYF